MTQIAKAKLKQYLAGRWDVLIDQIRNDLELEDAELASLLRFLGELEEEGWITKSFCKTHQADEYDPGPAQGA